MKKREHKSLANELGRRPTTFESLAYMGASPSKYFAFILAVITAIVIVMLLMGNQS